LTYRIIIIIIKVCLLSSCPFLSLLSPYGGQEGKERKEESKHIFKSWYSCLAGTTPIHPELGGETVKEIE